MLTTTALPFDETPEALARWLHDVADMPAATAAHQLLTALQALKQSTAAADTRMALLTQLLPAVLHAGNSLSAIALAESDETLSNRNRKTAKLALQVLRQSSACFYGLCDNSALTETAQQQALFFALQLLGLAQRNGYYLRQAPSASLWASSAQLLRLATKRAWLEQTPNHKIADFKRLPSPLQVLKRNVLFYLFTPQRFPLAELPTLFALAGAQCDALEWQRESFAHANFIWPLTAGLPTARAHNAVRYERDTVSINTRPLAHALQSGAVKTGLQPSTQNALANHLASYHSLFSSSTEAPFARAHLIIGFKAVSQWVLELSQRSTIARISSQAPGDDRGRDFGLMPLEHEKQLPFQRPLTSPQHRHLGHSISLRRTHSQGWILAEAQALTAGMDDLVLVERPQQPPLLGVVRQQQTHSKTGLTQLLLETCNLCCSADNCNHNDSLMPVLILHDNTDHNVGVIVASGSLRVGDSLRLKKGGDTVELLACSDVGADWQRFSVKVRH
jgi:hypothetical protein